MPYTLNWNKLIIGHWNANGICKKWDELKHFITDKNIDIMAVTETKLSQDIRLSMPGYKIARNDRNRRGGGVMLVYKNEIKCHEITTGTTNIETAAIKLENGPSIIGAYAPPDIIIEDNDLKTIFNSATKVIAVGDFNAKHSRWSCRTSNRNGRKIAEYTEKKQIIVVDPERPTTNPYTKNKADAIDIAILKNIAKLPSQQIHEELDSDHYPFTLTLTDTTIPLQSTAPRLNTHKTDWKKFREELHNSIIITKVTTITEINDSINELTKNINNALQNSTPINRAQNPSTKLPEDISKLIKQRNAARRKYQKKRTTESKQDYNKISQEIQGKIREWKNQKWADKLTELSTSDNSLWKMTKSLTKKTNTTIPQLNDGDDIAISNEEKAEALAKNFEKTHKITEKMGSQETEQIVTRMSEIIIETPTETDNIILTNPKEIKSIIRKFKNGKAPGKDGINNKTLKSLNNKALIQLTEIFNACLKNTYFPVEWKEATILAFHKPGKNPKETTSYRPISLLSTLSKILENIILNRIKDQGKLEEKLNKEQFGFRKNRSTVKQLARLTTDIIHNFNIKKSTAAALLDIEKAFDTVWHNNLIRKLDEFGLPNYLTKIVANFITNRTFRVKIENNYSTIKTITAGVPQGSILGPVLFIIYNRDIPKNQGTQLAVFADDTAVYSHSASKKLATTKIVEHTEELDLFFEDEKIKINKTKTEFIIFTRKTRIIKNTPNNVNIFNETVNRSRKVKYLGVILDEKLNFIEHTKHTIIKVNKAIGALIPLLGRNSSMSIKNKLLVYKVIILPAILYASPVWGGLISHNWHNKLQTIQNKCLRMALGARKKEKITTLHEKAQMQLLKEIISEHGRRFHQNNNMEDLGFPKTRGADELPYNIKYQLPHLSFP